MFIVLLTGLGQGCDYTIDCNKTFKTLKAATWDDARKEVAKICGDYSEPSIAKATILEISHEENFDTTTWKAERHKQMVAEELTARKALYEKLKGEFDK